MKLFSVLLALFLFLPLGGCSKKSKDFHWSNATSRGAIADTPIAGTINGKKGGIPYIRVKKWQDEYSWEFSNKGAESKCDIVMDNDAVKWSAKLLRTGTFSKKMDEEIPFDDYHAYYYYEQEDGSPMSVNVEWAAKVVIRNIDTANKTVEGWADFAFKDGRTEISGKFKADLCD